MEEEEVDVGREWIRENSVAGEGSKGLMEGRRRERKKGGKRKERGKTRKLLRNDDEKE